MNIQFFVTLLLIRGSQTEGVNDFCENENSQITQAIRVEDRILLFAKHPSDRISYYGVKGFKYSDTEFTFDSIEELRELPDWLTSADLLFAFEFPDKTHQSFGIRTIASTVNTPQELVGLEFTLDSNFQAEKRAEFPLNMYRTGAGDEKNLLSLIYKFPEKDVQLRIHSIMPFPYGYLHPRLFVFYLELPERPEEAEEIIDFKRHLLIMNESTTNTAPATPPAPHPGWEHDISNYDCLDQNIVNASFALTEIIVNNDNRFSFDFIEFLNHNFLIKRVDFEAIPRRVNNVMQTEEKISKNHRLLKNDSIASLFKCSPPTIPETPTIAPPTTTSVENASSRPETEEPETEGPETERPQTEGPETGRPETERPETGRPEAEGPETERPQTEGPETGRPETEGPETGRPEAEGPETERPQTEGPETGRPGSEGPETGRPEAEGPETERPQTEGPETGRPGSEGPETGRPGSEGPKIEDPVNEIPKSNETKKTESTETLDIRKSSTPQTTATTSESGSTVIWIILILILVLVVIGIIAYFLIPKIGRGAEPTPTPPAAPGSPTGPTVDITDRDVTPTPSDTNSVPNSSQKV